MTREPGRGYRRLFRLPLSGGAAAEREMDREIEAHIAMRVDDLVRAGMTPDEARAEARRRFGDFESARKRLHAEARRRDASLQQRDVVGSWMSDMALALRRIRFAPGFSALTIGTLALGIGATTAMFTLVEGVLLRPLPFPHGEQLVAFAARDSVGRSTFTISSADWLDYRAEAPSFRASAIYSLPRRLAIFDADSGIRLTAAITSPEFFNVLGSRFIAGRSYAEDDATADRAVAVVSERVWRGMLGADPTLSRTLRIGSRDYTVIGVVAARGEYPAGTDIWLCTKFRPESGYQRTVMNWVGIARLPAGVTPVRAERELAVVGRSIRDRDPQAIYAYGAALTPLRDSLVDYARENLRMLMFAVGFVLLIVCANVAAAALGRGFVRDREMAVRAAIGAGRGRLVRQLLIEHVVLALIAGAMGVALAWAALRIVLAAWGRYIPRAEDVRLDPTILAFAVVTSLAAGAAAGLLPALRGSRVSLQSVLASGGRSAARGGRGVTAPFLVTAEIALALVLLTGAGLLLRSLRTLASRDIGFDTAVVTVDPSLGGERYATDPSQRTVAWDEIIRAFAAVPGVQAVGAANWVPLSIAGTGFIEIPGRVDPSAAAGYRVITEDYLRALRVPLVAGRYFGAEDGATTERVVLVNQRMANVYWPGRSPLGAIFRATSQERQPGGGAAPWLRVVGVVGDMRHWGLEAEPRPEMYVLARQVPAMAPQMTFIIRGTGAPRATVPALRAQLRRVNRQLAVDFGTLDDRLASQLAPRRMTMSLLGAFALLALILAALGVYGVLSYAVAQRRRELAIRSALGAARSQVVRLVVTSAMPVALSGVAIGTLGSYLLSRTMAAMLVDVSAVDPATYLASTVILLGAAGLATLLPAWQAARLDPAITLQAE